MDLSSPWSWLALAASFAAGAALLGHRQRAGAAPTTPSSPPTRAPAAPPALPVGAEGIATITFATPLAMQQPVAAFVDAVFATGRVTACNDAFAAMRGETRREALLGRTLGALMPPHAICNRVAIEQLACQGGVATGVVTHGVRADGGDLFCLDDLAGEVRDRQLVAVRLSQRDLTQRIAAEKALARSEHQLREALAAARMGTWRFDVHADAISWSSSCFDVFGLTPGSFGGTLAAFAALVHGDDRERVMRLVDDAVHGRTENYFDVFRVQTADGSERWLEGRGRLEFEQRDRPLLTGTVMNVTARVHAERALRQSELRFANLAAAAFECIAVTANGRLLDVNDRFVETFGFAREELIGRPVAELVHPDDRAMVQERIERGWISRYEHRALHASGRVLMVEVQAREVPFDGVQGRVTSLRDVTHQRRHEAHLVRIAEGVSTRTGEAFLRSLVENLALVLGADHAFVAATDADGNTAETLAAFVDGRIVPNGKHDLRGAPCSEAAQRNLYVVPADVRALYPANTQLQALGVEAYVGAALRDADGRLLGVLAVTWKRPLEEDATAVASTLQIFAARVAAEMARRLIEARLRDSETRLRATIENTPNVAVQWYDLDGRVLFWNRASERVFGWTAAEAVGRTLEQLIHTPEEAVAFAAALRRISGTGDTVGPSESAFTRKDGSRGVCLSTLFEIPTANGQRAFVCMDVDVSARKRAEQRREVLARHLLVAQEAERRRLAGELHDSLGQTLSLIKNRAHLARGQHGAKAAAELDAIERLVSDSLAEVRALVHNLRPLHVEQEGLTAALHGLVDAVAASTSIRFERRLEAVDDVVRGDDATHVYRIAQEALHNLVEHSQAQKARFELERDVRCVRLRVHDDGIGFTPAASAGDGLGLESMAERARMLGGELTITSSPGAGTTLHLELPVRDAGGFDEGALPALEEPTA